MPKVKTLKHRVGETELTANLTVRANGHFYAKSVNPEEGELSGPVAEDVEAAWKKSARDYLERSTSKRKVILISYDSILLDGGKRSFFTDNKTTILLEVAIAEETEVTVGDEKTTRYTHHPDYRGLHTEDPIPFGFRLRGIQHHIDKEKTTVVEWTQEREDLVIRACHGIQSVVELLGSVFESEETLQVATQTGLPLRETVAGGNQ